MVPFYASPAAERVAIRRAVARAGCRMRSSVVERPLFATNAEGISTLADRGGGESRIVSRIACTDGWVAAELLLALAIEDSETDGARELARLIRAQAVGDADFARLVQEYVQARIRFVREEGELFQSGAVTLSRGAGDCDDHFRLSYALMRAGGLVPALGILHHGEGDVRGEPTHAGAIVILDGRAVWVETTVKAHFGEDPNAAARRLGLTSERSDIAKGIVVMQESDLAPLPDGFRDRNDPGQVLLDCEALQRLGFYPSLAPLVSDPTDVALRLAVIDFQRSHGLVADGLLGPATRLSLLHLLQAHGAEGFPYPGIGDVTTGAKTFSEDITDDDLRALIAFCAPFKALGMRATPEDFAQVWTAESGMANIQTRVIDPGTGKPPLFGGFNQMGPHERDNAGFRGDFFTEWLRMTLSEQLPFIADYYRRAAATGGGPKCLRDAASLYVANFAPAYMGHTGEPDFPLFKDDGNPRGPYAMNKGLDHGRKGYISVHDMKIAVDGVAGNARFKEVRSRLRALGADPSAPSGVGGVVAGAGGLLVGVGVLAAVLAAVAAQRQGWL